MSDSKVPLPNLDQESGAMPPVDPNTFAESGDTSRGAADLEAVFDVPVQVSAVLGRAKMDVGDLLKLGPDDARARPQGRRSDRHLRQQSPRRARRGRAG
jgi:flagellar motor switch/type III secretory pathway protein FliN